MRIHIITIGRPKLAYAKIGWEEYVSRLRRFHTLKTTAIADKFAYSAKPILEAAGNAYTIALVIEGQQLTSPQLADFLEKRSVDSKELCLLIGGPEGLPQEVIDRADYRLSLSKLTLPHDLAMVVTLEALYRASTILAGQPYHK